MIKRIVKDVMANQDMQMREAVRTFGNKFVKSSQLTRPSRSNLVSTYKSHHNHLLESLKSQKWNMQRQLPPPFGHQVSGSSVMQTTKLRLFQDYMKTQQDGLVHGNFQPVIQQYNKLGWKSNNINCFAAQRLEPISLEASQTRKSQEELMDLASINRAIRNMKEQERTFKTRSELLKTTDRQQVKPQDDISPEKQNKQFLLTGQSKVSTFRQEHLESLDKKSQQRQAQNKFINRSYFQKPDLNAVISGRSVGEISNSVLPKAQKILYFVKTDQNQIQPFGLKSRNLKFETSTNIHENGPKLINRDLPPPSLLNVKTERAASKLNVDKDIMNNFKIGQCHQSEEMTEKGGLQVRQSFQTVQKAYESSENLQLERGVVAHDHPQRRKILSIEQSKDTNSDQNSLGYTNNGIGLKVITQGYGMSSVEVKIQSSPKFTHKQSLNNLNDQDEHYYSPSKPVFNKIDPQHKLILKLKEKVPFEKSSPKPKQYYSPKPLNIELQQDAQNQKLHDFSSQVAKQTGEGVQIILSKNKKGKQNVQTQKGSPEKVSDSQLVPYKYQDSERKVQNFGNVQTQEFLDKQKVKRHIFVPKKQSNGKSDSPLRAKSFLSPSNTSIQTIIKKPSLEFQPQQQAELNQFIPKLKKKESKINKSRETSNINLQSKSNKLSSERLEEYQNDKAANKQLIFIDVPLSRDETINQSKSLNSSKISKQMTQKNPKVKSSDPQLNKKQVLVTLGGSYKQIFDKKKRVPINDVQKFQKVNTQSPTTIQIVESPELSFNLGNKVDAGEMVGKSIDQGEFIYQKNAEDSINDSNPACTFEPRHNLNTPIIIVPPELYTPDYSQMRINETEDCEEGIEQSQSRKGHQKYDYAQLTKDLISVTENSLPVKPSTFVKSNKSKENIKKDKKSKMEETSVINSDEEVPASAQTQNNFKIKRNSDTEYIKQSFDPLRETFKSRNVSHDVNNVIFEIEDAIDTYKMRTPADNLSESQNQIENEQCPEQSSVADRQNRFKILNVDSKFNIQVFADESFAKLPTQISKHILSLQPQEAKRHYISSNMHHQLSPSQLMKDYKYLQKIQQARNSIDKDFKLTSQSISLNRNSIVEDKRQYYDNLKKQQEEEQKLLKQNKKIQLRLQVQAVTQRKKHQLNQLQDKILLREHAYTQFQNQNKKKKVYLPLHQLRHLYQTHQEQVRFAKGATPQPLSMPFGHDLDSNHNYASQNVRTPNDLDSSKDPFIQTRQINSKQISFEDSSLGQPTNMNLTYNNDIFSGAQQIDNQDQTDQVIHFNENKLILPPMMKTNKQINTKIRSKKSLEQRQVRKDKLRSFLANSKDFDKMSDVSLTTVNMFEQSMKNLEPNHSAAQSKKFLSSKKYNSGEMILNEHPSISKHRFKQPGMLNTKLRDKESIKSNQPTRNGTSKQKIFSQQLKIKELLGDKKSTELINLTNKRQQITNLDGKKVSVKQFELAIPKDNLNSADRDDLKTLSSMSPQKKRNSGFEVSSCENNQYYNDGVETKKISIDLQNQQNVQDFLQDYHGQIKVGSECFECGEHFDVSKSRDNLNFSQKSIDQEQDNDRVNNKLLLSETVTSQNLDDQSYNRSCIVTPTMRKVANSITVELTKQIPDRQSLQMKRKTQEMFRPNNTVRRNVRVASQIAQNRNYQTSLTLEQKSKLKQKNVKPWQVVQPVLFNGNMHKTIRTSALLKTTNHRSSSCSPALLTPNTISNCSPTNKFCNYYHTKNAKILQAEDFLQIQKISERSFNRNNDGVTVDDHLFMKIIQDDQDYLKGHHAPHGQIHSNGSVDDDDQSSQSDSPVDLVVDQQEHDRKTSEVNEPEPTLETGNPKPKQQLKETQNTDKQKKPVISSKKFQQACCHQSYTNSIPSAAKKFYKQKMLYKTFSQN